METKFAEHIKHPPIPRVQNMFQHKHSIFPKCNCKISYKKSNPFLSDAYTQTDAHQLTHNIDWEWANVYNSKNISNFNITGEIMLVKVAYFLL